jgi:hypothetical protein
LFILLVSATATAAISTAATGIAAAVAATVPAAVAAAAPTAAAMVMIMCMMPMVMAGAAVPVMVTMIVAAVYGGDVRINSREEKTIRRIIPFPVAPVIPVPVILMAGISVAVINA